MTTAQPALPASAPPVEAEHRHRRGLVWPLILISVGAFALLANLGYISPWAWTDLLRLWPLVLVLIGVDLIVAPRSPLLALGVEALVIVGALAYVIASPNAVVGPGAATASVARGGASTLDLDLSFGGGRLQLAGAATGADLVSVGSTRDDILLSQTGPSVRLRQPDDMPFTSAQGVDWNVRVANDLPARITINAGAGDFVFDLSDIKATDVRVNMGAGSMRLVLPKPTGDVAVRIASGASSIAIEAPAGVDYRVNTSGALLSTSGRTESAAYATARDRVTVTVSAAASSVTIR